MPPFDVLSTPCIMFAVASAASGAPPGSFGAAAAAPERLDTRISALTAALASSAWFVFRGKSWKSNLGWIVVFDGSPALESSSLLLLPLPSCPPSDIFSFDLSSLCSTSSGLVSLSWGTSSRREKA